MRVLDWLLDSDPAIRWQVLRDFVRAPAKVVAAERARVATEGCGARLLALQGEDGKWAGGACFPARAPGRNDARCKSALTRIYGFGNIRAMESAFAILAEPNRRALLSLLAGSERSVGELQRRLRMPQPSVSKHLKVLREAGFVEARVDAQRRVYRLRPEPFMELDSWLSSFRRFWSVHVDALERHLDRMEPRPATARTPRAAGRKGRKR